jgi:hypothetical protein
MAWGEAKCAGLALAAVLWDDRSLEDIAAHLAAAPLAQARADNRVLHESSTADKTRLLRARTEFVRGEVTARAADLPPRARALLARHVPRDVGRRWLEQVPPARADYQPSRCLVATLHHFARTPSPSGPVDAAAHSRG